MLKTIKIKDWILKIDRDKTKEIYEKLPLIQCDCIYCRNYLIAYKSLPKKALQLLNKLGIDPIKDTEVYEFNENEDGSHLYGGMHFIVGKIIKGLDFLNPKTGQLTYTTLTKNFELGFLPNIHAPALEIFKLVDKGELIQLDFTCNIPWVLKEK